ncbi:ketopantoate reductase family protein [Natronobiforma cellulositropha]|uniref:ketopantoate reductase family protein n=1 Tax=Natronobiforma cellulositropha TaxID=1679076 RepID=UPI0021D5E67D|nr:ketopantoate reductase family protein [Natronobiforma cellulositropha]
MEIVVFGAGSLGSLVGGLLAREPRHEVTLVGREDHAAAVEDAGLRLEGALEAHVFPAARTDATGLETDLALVTVKAADTPEAARTLATGRYGAVCTLQNGMGTASTLAEALEPETPVLAGTATYGARLRSPGVVECTGLGEVVVGAREGGPSPVATRVGEALASGGLETAVADDMPRRRWEKLAVNAGINAVTALARLENGTVLEPPAAAVSRAATREAARVARAEGVSLSNREALAALERVATATAGNTSSMHQDVLAGRRTEIDAINGTVCERADEYGLEVPTNRLLTALVRAWESERGARSPEDGAPATRN